MEKGGFAGEVDLRSGQGKDLLQGFSGFGGSKKQRLSPPISEANPQIAPTPRQKVSNDKRSPTQPTAASFGDAPLTERIVKMTVQRPTFAQLKEITLELGMHLSDAQINEFWIICKDRLTPMIWWMACQIIYHLFSTAHQRFTPYRRGKSTKRMVYQNRSAWCPQGTSCWQNCCTERQCLPCWCAYDERLVYVKRIHARCRCHRRNPALGCGGNDNRKSALRILLLFRGQSHECNRSSA